jgi:hypothetical protein
MPADGIREHIHHLRDSVCEWSKLIERQLRVGGGRPVDQPRGVRRERIARRIVGKGTAIWRELIPDARGRKLAAICAELIEDGVACELIAVETPEEY